MTTVIVILWTSLVAFCLGIWAGHRAGWGSGYTDGYVKGYKDGTHGRTFKRAREGGAY